MSTWVRFPLRRRPVGIEPLLGSVHPPSSGSLIRATSLSIDECTALHERHCEEQPMPSDKGASGNSGEGRHRRRAGRGRARSTKKPEPNRVPESKRENVDALSRVRAALDMERREPRSRCASIGGTCRPPPDARFDFARTREDPLQARRANRRMYFQKPPSFRW